ncbi:aldo/keto reductase [Noviherbaspirillum sp.]|uniref:aldo/keto reductase n=1 Tax=Noviherbaspirillum sp. TaxID=1926288 RepID=UPI002D6F34CF|nr:aldo/keto reductase [Noviherbaspirillum sp.]HZW20709.1 aldo/keto reductase [Noviherbaspirillum sp.]
MTGINRREAMGLIAAATALGFGGAFAAPPSEGRALHMRRIPSSGEALPVVGLGTWQTFDVGPGEDERAPLAEVLSAFVALGGRVIDSSPMYGRSEEVTGELAEKLRLRDRLFVATKVWTRGKEAGIRQMEESMRKLRARPVDLMQVHNLLDVDTHLATLREWKQQGLVRYIGITHYTAGSHDEVAAILRKHAVDFVQINFSAAEREAEQRLLPLAQERGVAVIVNRPFAGGEVIRQMRNRPLPPWAAEIECSSWAQILLKYVTGHPAVTCAIPATSKLTHLRDNMQAGIGRLPDRKQRELIARSL